MWAVFDILIVAVVMAGLAIGCILTAEAINKTIRSDENEN